MKKFHFHMLRKKFLVTKTAMKKMQPNDGRKLAEVDVVVVLKPGGV